MSFSDPGEEFLDLQRKMFDQMAAGEQPSQEDIARAEALAPRRGMSVAIAREYRECCARIEDAIGSGKKPDLADLNRVRDITRQYETAPQADPITEET